MIVRSSSFLKKETLYSKKEYQAQAHGKGPPEHFFCFEIGPPKRFSVLSLDHLNIHHQNREEKVPNRASQGTNYLIVYIHGSDDAIIIVMELFLKCIGSQNNSLALFSINYLKSWNYFFNEHLISITYKSIETNNRWIQI